MKTGKKIMLNRLGQASYVFVYEKLKKADPNKKMSPNSFGSEEFFKGEVRRAKEFQNEHEDHCEAIIVTCYEMELFSMGRRGPDWQSKWYDFFWDTSCKKCREEIKKEEFWESCNPRNNIESRIEKEEERLKKFEEDFLRGKMINKFKLGGKK